MESGSQFRRYMDPISGFRATIIEVSTPLKEMQKIQNLLPAGAILLGRAVCGAGLLAAQLDENEVVSLYFRGDGPMEYLFAECNRAGQIRGYTAHPEVLPESDGILDLGAALGKGTLTVVRTHPQKQTPQRGTVSLVDGLIAKDIAGYLRQSEQRRSLVSTGVKLNADGTYKGACGILIEMLPGAVEDIAVLLEENFKNAVPLSERIESAASTSELFDSILRDYLEGFHVREIEPPTPVVFHCPCSRERLIRSLRMFSKTELTDIVDKRELTRAKCEFCGREYELDWSIVKDIRDGRHRTDFH